jgi:hypothetical protein
MNNDKIRPDWVPSGYQDKPEPDIKSVVKAAEVKHALYKHKVVKGIPGFKTKKLQP